MSAENSAEKWSNFASHLSDGFQSFVLELEGISGDERRRRCFEKIDELDLKMLGLTSNEYDSDEALLRGHAEIISCRVLVCDESKARNLVEAIKARREKTTQSPS